MIKKILLPLDGSETAEAGIEVAHVLAVRWQAEVVLVRAVGDPVLVANGILPSLILRWKQHEDAAAESYLKEIQIRFQEVKTHALTPVGMPREALAQAAVEHGCDLIVMASHGRSGVARWLLGSVA